MTIEKLERVMWRVRKDNPNTNIIRNRALELAIMQEIGINKRTYKDNRRALTTLGWIRSHTKTKIELTNKDLTDA